MADIESLDYKSILDMTNDEALDTIRRIRLARRTPEKKTKVITKSAKKEVKQDMSQSMAAELLKIIGGNK